MYSVSDLSKITGINDRSLRSKVDRGNVNFFMDKGIRYFSKRQAEKICGMPLNESFSELLFEDFMDKNPNISREEAFDALCIPKDYVFEQREYVFQSKLNYLPLNEL